MIRLWSVYLFYSLASTNLKYKKNSELEHEFFVLPVQRGGLNILNPTKNVRSCHETSRKYKENLINAIKNGQPLNNNEHICTWKDVMNQKKLNNFLEAKVESERILKMLPGTQMRPLKQIINRNAGQ